MRVVRIAGTAIDTSRLGLGTSNLSHIFSGAQRQRLLGHAWERGIRYYDTSPLYGHELGERELGRFAKGRRDKIILTTKFGLLPSNVLSRSSMLMYAQKIGASLLRRVGLHVLDYLPKRDYSAAHARDRLHRSLYAMQTDYVDFLYLHEPTLHSIRAPDELVGELCDLQAAGKIRYFGISATLENCSMLSNKFPGLGLVWQVDAGTEMSEINLARFRQRGAQVTCGHFRKSSGGPESGNRGLESVVRKGLANAVELNRAGVILFSTRSLDHIDGVVDAIESIEKSQSGVAA